MHRISQLPTYRHPVLDRPLTMDALRDRIKKLKHGKACGLDLISTELLKALAKAKNDTMLAELLKIYNYVVTTGTIPPGGMTGMVKPIHKSGDPADWANYRLITLLSIVWKLFESLTGDRLSDLMKKHNLLSEEQMGFRKNRRCAHAQILLTARARRGWPTAVSFLDLRKA